MEKVAPKPEPKQQREATRLESVEEIRKAHAANRAVPAGTLEAPAIKSGAVAFKPARRPPMAVLTVCDDGKADGELRARSRRPLGHRPRRRRRPHSARRDDVRLDTPKSFAKRIRQAGAGLSRICRARTETFVRLARVPFSMEAKSSSAAPCSASRTRPLTCPALRWQPRPPAVPCRPKLRAGKLWRPPTQGLSGAGAAAGNRQALLSGCGEQWLAANPLKPAIALTDDVQIEPRHAKVLADAKGNWSIEDAGSQNGVWLRVDRHLVDSVCEFQLASSASLWGGP